MENYARELALCDPLRQGVMRSAIEALQLPPGSRGLDAGCGIGSNTTRLAEAVGRDGHVTGLDISHEHLAHAKEAAHKSGLSGRTAFLHGDIRDVPLEDNAFGWAWSADCVGHVPIDPVPLIRELARVVRPGGTVAILAWSSQQFLPGHPLLEARLNATAAGVAPFTEGTRPELHFLRAQGWFRNAGLLEPQGRTFVQDIAAPLSEDVRAGLASFFGMRWGGAQTEVSQKDWAEFQRLCEPQSPDFIADLVDYYAFFVYTMFCGTVPK